MIRFLCAGKIRESQHEIAMTPLPNVYRNFRPLDFERFSRVGQNAADGRGANPEIPRSLLCYWGDIFHNNLSALEPEAIDHDFASK